MNVKRVTVILALCMAMPAWTFEAAGAPVGSGSGPSTGPGGRVSFGPPVAPPSMPPGAPPGVQIYTSPRSGSGSGATGYYTYPSPPGTSSPPSMPPGVQVYTSPRSGSGSVSGSGWGSGSTGGGAWSSGRTISNAWHYPGGGRSIVNSAPNAIVYSGSRIFEYLPTGQIVVSKRNTPVDPYEGDRVELRGPGGWLDLGQAPSGHGYYAPGWGYANNTWVFGSHRRGPEYRRVYSSPYRHQSYYACPWYNTYYYPTSPWWDNATWYAPGFALQFAYKTNAGYWNNYFGYGYGGGVRFGDCGWLYSWYPFGGFERVEISDSVPVDYTHYVAPRVGED